MLVALAAGEISVPVLTLVIGWLVVILFGFSLLAPRNAVASPRSGSSPAPCDPPFWPREQSLRASRYNPTLPPQPPRRLLRTRSEPT